MPKQKRSGRNSKRPSFQRYWSRQKGYENRAELHREARVRRFDAMVAESRGPKGQARRAAKLMRLAGMATVAAL